MKSQVERELKFAVPESFVIPQLPPAVGMRWTAIESFDMTAVYHDTADLRLIRWGVTLRRRWGGSDEGWHLKIPLSGADGLTRQELHLPLSAGSAGFVPAELADIVTPLTRGERLVPLATVQTHRSPIRILDDSGQPRAEVVDDRVQVLDASGAPVTQFREIEVEAWDAERDTEVLTALAAAIMAAGGQARSLSKAAQALGPQVSQPPDVPAPAFPGPSGAAAVALAAMFRTHVRHLLFADMAWRRDLPDAVHQMRVAARRLRSALRTFAPILDLNGDMDLDGELAWLASELSRLRDTEVLTEHLDEELADVQAVEAPGAGSEEAAELLRTYLANQLANARNGAIAAVRSDRYTQLLDDLVALAADPPVHPVGPCALVLPGLVWTQWRTLVKAMKELDADAPADQWHRVRIKAKRARYAADAVAPIFGGPVQRLATRLALITDALGTGQDAHVAQQLITTLVAQPGTSAAAAFSLGHLHAREVTREMTARADALEAWPAARKAAKRSRLDGQ